MKKNLSFVILAITLTMTMLCGCIDLKEEDDAQKLIGSWQTTTKCEEVIDDKVVNSLITITLTFNEDNSFIEKGKYSKSGETYSLEGVYIANSVGDLTITVSDDDLSLLKYSEALFTSYEIIRNALEIDMQYESIGHKKWLFKRVQ